MWLDDGYLRALTAILIDALVGRPGDGATLEEVAAIEGLFKALDGLAMLRVARGKPCGGLLPGKE